MSRQLSRATDLHAITVAKLRTAGQRSTPNRQAVVDAVDSGIDGIDANQNRCYADAERLSSEFDRRLLAGPFGGGVTHTSTPFRRACVCCDGGLRSAGAPAQLFGVWSTP